MYDWVLSAERRIDERWRERETSLSGDINILSPHMARLPLSASVYHSLVLSSAVEQVDHKIFRIPQKCNNTANIFVWEYIVDDALTIGCAAEMKFMNITLHCIIKLYLLLNITDHPLYVPEFQKLVSYVKNDDLSWWPCKDSSLDFQ